VVGQFHASGIGVCAGSSATIRCVAKRSRKPADLNRLAAALVEQATDEKPPEPESAQTQAGRRGGQKGGRARASKLTPERRSEIARRAAKARWASSD
jgi:hypothetical protein